MTIGMTFWPALGSTSGLPINGPIMIDWLFRYWVLYPTSKILRLTCAPYCRMRVNIPWNWRNVKDCLICYWGTPEFSIIVSIKGRLIWVLNTKNTYPPSIWQPTIISKLWWGCSLHSDQIEHLQPTKNFLKMAKLLFCVKNNWLEKNFYNYGRCCADNFLARAGQSAVRAQAREKIIRTTTSIVTKGYFSVAQYSPLILNKTIKKWLLNLKSLKMQKNDPKFDLCFVN